MRITGRMTSGGRQNCADRSGAKIEPWVRERICVPEKERPRDLSRGLSFCGMRMKGLEKIFYPRNPVKRRITTSTPLGYLIGYLKYYMGPHPKRISNYICIFSYRCLNQAPIFMPFFTEKERKRIWKRQ